jgi:HK97 family phage portal protein
MPPSLTGSQWTGTSYVDSYKRSRNPTPNELMAELKGVAWACASINAGICANYPPHLYVTTRYNQPRPKCARKAISARAEQRLRSAKHLAARTKAAATIEEVTEHPLIDLLSVPCPPWLSAFDLWELTTLYQEVHGMAYWYLEAGPLGIPVNIWVLPTQNVTPRRAPGSDTLVDYYEYRTGRREQRFGPDEVIRFAYPDPRDPYLGGLSPLRAAFEQVSLTSEFAATKSAIYENRAIPSAIISPDEVLGEEERDRLEAQWNQKFRRGGSGRVVVGETGLRVQLLQQSMGDLAALADLRATKEDIANAFHCPIAYFTTQTNLANLQASQAQHMMQAISPRLERRDERLNQQLVPLYDDSGRLFLASEDPVPVDANLTIAQQQADLQYGVVSINEVRGERGLPPVPWGHVPWLPQRWLPTDVPRQQPGAQGEQDPSADYVSGTASDNQS